MNKMLLLREMVAQACVGQALAGMETTVEKELLHYDIMAALSQSGLLSKLTFQGGTCLRMAYGSQRLSEDLDFAGGVDFSPLDYQALAQVLIDYFTPRYGLNIRIKTPKARTFQPGTVAVGRWMISIETQPQAKHLPNQKIKLEVANIPAYSTKTKVLTLNYPSLQNGLSTVLVNCESQEEIFADKVVALCLRKHIKARDLWDLVMLEQQQLAVNDGWVIAKFKDYGCEDQPLARLNQRKQAMADYWQSGQFEAEMRRFLPTDKVTETLGKPEFMPYFIDTVDVLIDKTIRRWEGEISAGITPQFRL